ncbi:hypothetical protein [Sorangium atrum]|uniref:Uncharacterized protein n=1 Tax=Sorangium atrum TaxID=2995308 RepID=A0ABT5CF36_9BACT|nr:hypothetical protein [Sorangium aterium]MDC0685002.1 hypothetical protein [Sorangium aterium]
MLVRCSSLDLEFAAWKIRAASRPAELVVVCRRARHPASRAVLLALVDRGALDHASGGLDVRPKLAHLSGASGSPSSRPIAS